MLMNIVNEFNFDSLYYFKSAKKNNYSKILHLNKFKKIMIWKIYMKD